MLLATGGVGGQATEIRRPQPDSYGNPVVTETRRPWTKAASLGRVPGHASALGAAPGYALGHEAAKKERLPGALLWGDIRQGSREKPKAFLRPGRGKKSGWRPRAGPSLIVPAGAARGKGGPAAASSGEQPLIIVFPANAHLAGGGAGAPLHGDAGRKFDFHAHGGIFLG